LLLLSCSFLLGVFREFFESCLIIYVMASDYMPDISQIYAIYVV
jgi:hypothetical protein